MHWCLFFSIVFEFFFVGIHLIIRLPRLLQKANTHVGLIEMNGKQLMRNVFDLLLWYLSFSLTGPSLFAFSPAQNKSVSKGLVRQLKCIQSDFYSLYSFFLSESIVNSMKCVLYIHMHVIFFITRLFARLLCFILNTMIYSVTSTDIVCLHRCIFHCGCV